MKFFKPIAGMGYVIFGAIGLILCLIAIGGTWIAGNRIQDRIVQVSPTVKTIMGSVNNRLNQIDNVLQSAKDGGSLIVRSAREYSNSAFKNENTSAAISDIIDEQFKDRFHSVQRLAKQIHETLNGLSHLFVLMGSISPVSLERCATDGPLMGPLRGVTDNLVRISDLLDQVKKCSDELRENPGISQQILAELPELIAQIDIRLGNIHDAVLECEKGVSEIGARAADLKSRIGFWINSVSMIISLLIIWLGAGQLSLFIHGCRILRRE